MAPCPKHQGTPAPAGRTREAGSAQRNLLEVDVVVKLLVARVHLWGLGGGGGGRAMRESRAKDAMQRMP